MVVMQVSAALSRCPRGERPTLVHQKRGRAHIFFAALQRGEEANAIR
jgi:hypothetical protein